MPPLQTIAYVEVESVSSCINKYSHTIQYIASINLKLKIIRYVYWTCASIHAYLLQIPKNTTY
jgi:hypothetical protein